MRLYVGNLAENATEQCVKDIFGKYGMRTCTVTRGERKAFAIVHVEDAERAIAELDGKEVRGSVLRVLKAVDRNKQCCAGGYEIPSQKASTK